MQKKHPSGVGQVHAASAKHASRWRRRPPTGVAGAVFWLALCFGLLWLLRLAPNRGGPLLGWMQLLAGLALICLAVPLAWRMVHQHLLWSLRNKLILTYILIGLAPVVLFVTFAGVPGLHRGGPVLHTPGGHAHAPTVGRVGRYKLLPRFGSGTDDARPRRAAVGTTSARTAWLSAQVAAHDEWSSATVGANIDPADRRTAGVRDCCPDSRSVSEPDNHVGRIGAQPSACASAPA